MKRTAHSSLAAVNDFVARHRQGTAFGNTVIQRYVQDPKFVKNAVGEAERKRFGEVVELFRKYGDRYDVDHLLMMAQGYQESQLEQLRRSPVGAIGVIQFMPATGAQMAVGDITQLEPNVHGGVKYMRWILDNHFDDRAIPPTDRVLLGLAAYNAGPTRIQQMRREAARRGLDPNRWFGNVEVVTAQETA